MKLLLIFLPLLAHVLFGRVVRRAPVVTTALAAAASLAITLIVVMQSPVWPEAYRIAWLGVSAKGNNRLVVGGPPENSICGWPNEALTPAMSIAAQTDKEGLIFVEGGGAFVFVRGADGVGPWEPVNGAELKPEEDKIFEDPLSRRRYVFRVRPDGWALSSIRFRLTIHAEGPPRHLLADVPLRSSGGEGSVTSLAPLLELSTATLDGALAERIALRTWAGGIRLFVPRSRTGVVRVIEPGATAKASIPLPCETIVRWAGNSPVKALLRFEEGVIKCDFLRPWRWTSPLPPRKDSGYPTVTFCAQPQPKDHAFLLPLGRMAAAMRVERELGMDDWNKLALLEPKSALGFTLIPPDAFEPPATWSGEQAAISRTVLSAGDYGFDVGIIYDLPGFLGLVGSALPAFAIFFFALWMTSARMGVVEESRTSAFGVALSLWVFLCVRLLLALRYALEPAHVDRVAVEGVIGAYVGLAAIPALVLLFARLAFLNVQPSPDDRGPRLHVLGFIGAWPVAIGLTLLLAGNLWPSWPVNGLRFAIAIGLAAGLGAILCGMLDYSAHIQRSDGLRRILVGWCRPIASVLGRLWERIFDEGKGLAPLILVMIALIFTCSILGVVLAFGTTREGSEEILIPLGCIWLPVLFWLTGQARAAANPDRARLGALRLFGLVILFAVAPIALQVILSRDVGTAFAAFAAFFSLACLLWAMRPRRLGWAVLSTLVILGCASIVLALKAPAIFDFGEAGIRIRSFVHGDKMQIQYLFGVGIPADDNPSGLKADKILNVSQHTWENKALAHEGGVYGMGFGEAPVRRSHVPMHTVQCDSVFSFYILSEHGLLGGLALLLASFVPFFYLLRNARPRLDVGFGLAFVVTGAFAIEMLMQAAMNLGYLPFTGRNLPLLAVISPTDLAKWALFFAVAVRGLFLRYDRDGSLNVDAAVLSAPTDGFAFSSVIPPLVAGIPPIVLALFVWADARRIADKELDKPFTWDVLDRQVNELQKKRYVTVDESKHELRYNNAPPNVQRLNLDENRLLRQEIERFNQLPLEERYRERGIEDFRRKLGAVGDTHDYDALMDELRKKASVRSVQPRPPIFEMRFVPDPRNENEQQVAKPHRVSASKDGESGEWEIRANGDFNSQLHFKRTPQQTLPQLAWEGSRRTGLLLGPAWAMGRDVIAYDPDGPLPWVPQLADALRQEWDQIGPEAGSRFKRLTLSPHLHEAAFDFVARQGRAHHANLLAAAAQRKSSDSREIRERIPPRVALSILDLTPETRGEVVALAGWPRTTSRPFWHKSASGEWLPPAQWLEKNAPESLKRRYLGDRNFDLMLMGSASKPIFAAAALAAQPGLDKRLYTLGAEERVNDLFGARVADDPWNESWHGGPGPWRNFDNYLAYSDNRYHIRLGFLALAERDGDTIAKAAPLQPGIDSVVSLDNSPSHHPWQAFPKFPALIGFRQDSPTRMEKLNETAFAQQLKAFFPVGVTAGELRHTRHSFWSGNEEHDVSRPQSTDGRTQSGFDRISPQSVKLDLDRVVMTREYIMLLLGGLTNMWSNVDFAGSFGTTVLGRPIVPHIVAGDQLPKAANRTEFVAIAERLRPGLKGVVKFGTASTRFAVGKPSVFDRWTARGYELYAKTGTLEEDDITKRKTSRLVLALVRWSKSKPAEVRNGLVFSLVTEHATTGAATSWLQEFIVDNDDQIRAFLDRTE